MQMKLRNGFRMIAVLILIAALMITGCSKSSSSNESSGGSLKGKTVTVLLSAGGVGQFNAWKERSKEFTKKTGIKVKFIETPYENLLQNITTDGISNRGEYDLVVHLDTMGSSISQFLEPLDPYVKRDHFDLNRWPKSVLDLSTFDNKLLSLPVRAHVQMLFYRKDIFKKLNLQPPTTWSELETDSKKITENTNLSGIVPYYASGNNGQNLYMWTAYLWSNGGDIFDKNMKPTFASKQGVEATQKYIDLLVKDKVAPPGSVTFGEQDSRTYFKQGKGAMWVGWWWVYPEFNSKETTAKGVAGNVGFAPVPGWEGKQSQANVSTFPLAMMKGSKNKDAAWEVLKWIAEPSEELDMVTKTLKNEVPATVQSTVVTQTANLRNKELNDLSGGFYNVAADNFENARTLPKIKEWPQVADILSSAISKMATGGSVETNLQEASKKVEQLLDKAGYYK
ncbi:extracellular solute-binding protein [Neobacillus cucumis]|uniref:ABC transporter substrate-binding protein n=1 Tax=Neobacillus cucumis TaxID=1740721 RepID=UPI0018DF48E5|nr:extracellular solute-binding protein [Neobacillus cucumis]MBI0579513.1 extracellular solute-binding protein [Neobacillus cucumis]